ncbi:MAG: hypothetical protein ACI9OJ_004739, partial [Myxococcota bacterium]
DIDRDGDLDILVSNINSAPTLLRNDLEGGHWLQLELVHPTLSPVVGAIVTLQSGGRTQRRWIAGTSSYGGSSGRHVHFGLGEATMASDIRVRWPDGTEQLVGDLAADQFVRVAAP